MEPKLVLASTSPQRRAILEQLGIAFAVATPRYEEGEPRSSDPAAFVEEHARGKARSVAGADTNDLVLGVDTAVVLAGRVLGKPRGLAEAREMLAELSGKTHEVVSGLCLIGLGWEDVRHDVTRVVFRELRPRDLDAYVETGEWRGRAGAYAIQGRGAVLVRRIEGDYLNVVGLPGALLLDVLAERAPGLFWAA